MRLRMKILFMCLGSTLVALLLQTYLFQDSSSGFIYNQAKEESENSLRNMQNEISAFVKGIESSMIEVYMEKDFIQALKEEKRVENLRAEFYRKAYEIGTTNFETEDSVVSFYLYTPQHEIISTYRRAVTPKHNYASDIYQEPEEENAEVVRTYAESEEAVMLITSYYNQYREKDILRFVLKLYYNGNRSHKIGYAVCDVDSKKFISIMKKYGNEKTMYIWLQPKGDRPAVAYGELSRKEAEYFKEMSEKIRSKHQTGTFQLEKQEVFQVEQAKYNLTAYSMMPQSVLQQNQKALTRNLLLIAGLMVVIASALTILVSHSIIRPLDMLMDTIQRIKGGEAHLRTQVVNHDEIGELGQNFNEMLDQMEELKEKESQAKLLASQAEYKALQAQINPHFLYNTLETMSSIAEIRDCPEVSLLSQSLSNIFRYSLNMKEPFSTVAEEIAHLKNYCYVMDVRMRDNVKYIYEIDKEALSDRLPRISIQPLVENALNHGLRNKRGEKIIHIMVKKEGGMLKLRVSDNGVGMNAEKLNEELEKNDRHYVEKGDSIGLHNINARIKMLCGERYGIRIQSAEGEGTSVWIILPEINGKLPERQADGEKYE
ncbi:MAG: sensor histidine kinase [Lachnospiraceae bacterium]|nr:sensor histidine kinase [Lachnospiraceae bacterium]